MSIHNDNRVPLQVRLTLSNAALAYADALVTGDVADIELSQAMLNLAVEDCRICLRASELGME